MIRVKKHVIMPVILLCVLGMNLYAQDKNTALSNIKETLKDGNFVFKAERMFPVSGDPKVLTTGDYELQITEEEVNAYLPYYGRVYNPTFRGGRIQFSKEPINYDFQVNTEKNKVKIECNIDTQKEFLQINMEITPEGSATLTINSNERESISYLGKIQEN